MSRATAGKSAVSTAKSQSEKSFALPAAREPTSRTCWTAGWCSTISIALSPMVTETACPLGSTSVEYRTTQSGRSGASARPDDGALPTFWSRSTVMVMTSLRALPLILRWAAIGAFSAAVVGGVVGLVVGLVVHPATAWFAVFELGIPASILGGLLGLATGAMRTPSSRRPGGQAPRTWNRTPSCDPVTIGRIGMQWSRPR